MPESDDLISKLVWKCQVLRLRAFVRGVHYMMAMIMISEKMEIKQIRTEFTKWWPV